MSYLSLTERRREFINAGIRVVAREGVARATTRRIADEAGATTAILHYCFDSKDDLFEEVFAATVSVGMAAIQEGDQPNAGIGAMARAIAHAFTDMVRSDPEIQVAFTELNFWALRHPGTRHLAATAYRDYMNATVELLRRGSRGEGEEAADHEVIARRIIAIIDGAALQFMSLDDETLEEIVDHGIADMLAGMASS